jgi:hypothetical protein
VWLLAIVIFIVNGCAIAKGIETVTPQSRKRMVEQRSYKGIVRLRSKSEKPGPKGFAQIFFIN